MMTRLTNDGGPPQRIHDEESLDRAAAIISALDSVLRIRILLALRERTHVVHELVSFLGKSQPLISQHLRVLKRAGIVDSERSGREVRYRLASETAVDIIDAAADVGSDTEADAPADTDAGTETDRDDLAVRRQHRNGQPAGERTSGAALVAPADHAPEPGLASSTPAPTDPATR